MQRQRRQVGAGLLLRNAKQSLLSWADANERKGKVASKKVVEVQWSVQLAGSKSRGIIDKKRTVPQATKS